MHGRLWTGFVARFGVCFRLFRPSERLGGLPPGLPVLLLHRSLVGAVIGVFGGYTHNLLENRAASVWRLFRLLGFATPHGQ